MTCLGCGMAMDLGRGENTSILSRGTFADFVKTGYSLFG
jgi:hypothetical protein